MRSRTLLTLGLVLCLALSLQTSTTSARSETSCLDPAGCISLAPGEPIRVGTFVVSDLGIIGRESARAVELAAAGRVTVAGRSIELVHLGDGCVPDLATTTAQAVAAQPQLVGVIGPTCSVVAREIDGILGGAGIVTLTPSSTQATLTAAGLRDPFFFRIVYNDLYHMDALAAHLGGGSAALVVADGFPFAGMADRFTDLFAGSVTSVQTVDGNQDDFSSELAAIALEEPDAIVFLTFRGGAFVSQARSTVGLEATTLATTGDIASELLQQLEDPTPAEGLVAAVPGTGFLGEEPYLSELGAPFTTQYGEPTLPYHAHAYDAANLLFDAIESFPQPHANQGLIIGRSALRDAVAATSGYPGVSGTLTCDPNGDCNPQEFVIRVVVGGVLVEPA